MRAELRAIYPHNYSLDWATFVAADHSESWNGHGWFTLDIGPEGEQGTNTFQAYVATPTASHKAIGNGELSLGGFVVESFDPDSIRQVLKSYVASIEGADWTTIVDQLRRRLLWEYEGMNPVK